MAKSKNTYPELIAQKLLDELEIPYTTHSKQLPGTPDIVVEKLKLAIFVHGCFWHKHTCQKITAEDQAIIDKDTSTIQEVINAGYKPIILWECDLTNNQIQTKNKLSYLLRKLESHVLTAATE